MESRGEVLVEGATEEHPDAYDLMITVIALGVIVFLLIVIIIYGYCKFLRRKKKKTMEEEMEEAGKGSSDDKRESLEDALPPLSPQKKDLSQISQMSVPVKMRKRSMTFSETDEECRKYREDLGNPYEEPPETAEGGHRSRKKSVVTFGDVQEINADGM